ncbi:asparagine synthase (glutamine-hydrolyzing) [bacterium]|jgi:asparagine synthase (glutamine-hydrolysing)|nr:asparagine synthase (glutamine-hydrolyzing) [bacterium]
MCGFAGFYAGKWGFNSTDICKNMIKRLHHRGPDDSGIWVSNEDDVTFGHVRLSIQDLSSAGHQPMASLCGRYIIVYNGEIYNHKDIRKELSSINYSIKWNGHSDTETLLSAISVWGVEESIKRCVGMFAFAIWDKFKHELILGRDRLGEKPLYYGWQGNTFLFGSELKALREHPAFLNVIDRDALCLFFRHNTIASPHSIYKGIHKLLPGSVLYLRKGSNEPIIKKYWSIKSVAEIGSSSLFLGDEKEALISLEQIMSQAVSGQMISDVPLGAFLSGGVDSSIVTALMQANSISPIKTFSIGFSEQGYNEAEHAKAVAKYLGTDHTELYVSSSEALDVIPRLATMFDEPFSDSSQIPTYLVSSMAKNHVTVALSGDGGDELFAGYNRHFRAKSIWKRISYLPLPIRKLVSKMMLMVPPQTWNQLYRMLTPIIPAHLQFNLPDDKMQKLAEVLSVDSPESMYRSLVSHWKYPENIVLGSKEPITILTDSSRFANLSDFENKMMFQDMVSYLPDDILTKVDRAAMAVSLETRVPMLDHRLVEFAWQLPLHMKIRNGEGKWLLKQLLYKYVPNTLIDRPKMGFGVPIDSWLRGPLRDWAESLLNENRLQQEGYLNPAPIRKKWEEHLSGKRNWQYHIWDVLMFQQWLETQ